MAPRRRGLDRFVLIFIVFMEVATPQFIMQYDARPNRLFIEYLGYPQEVFSTLWHGFRIALLRGCALTVVLGIALVRLLKRTAAGMTPAASSVEYAWPYCSQDGLGSSVFGAAAVWTGWRRSRRPWRLSQCSRSSI